MNLDYTEITKFLGKDKLCLEYLQWNASYINATKYYFNGCNKVELWHNVGLNQVTIKGSIPYFINGHNYYSTSKDWLEGLDYLTNCLKVNLYNGLVEKFEFGTIQEIPFQLDTFLRYHVKLNEMKTIEYKQGSILTGKYFDNSNLRVKLYDVSRNIKQKLTKPIQEELERVHGWDKDKHYVKIENHYKKPEVHFKRNILLNELLSSEFQAGLKNDLLTTYQGIMKTGNSIIPTKKADINAGTIPLMVLKELEAMFNFKTEDLIKQKLKAIPENILSHDDKKARQRTLRDNMKKISLNGSSEYDISELLKNSIQNQLVN